MALSNLDHVTIQTARLAELTGFYAEVLGLDPGARPSFRFPGAWLYCDGRAAVHLIELQEAPNAGDPRIEHFAFRAEGLSDFLAQLRARGVAYSTAIVPDLEIRQVHIRDPDGNHVEIAFGAQEEADLSDYPGS
jgi:catechol 2,3-dioxygenase-like lactoylglutathione lyase family enzyme